MTKIPVTICGKKILLKVHVVDTDIPLLLSRSSKKELGMSLDLPNDTAFIKSGNGKNEFKLYVSDSGHYILPVLESTENKIHETLLSLTEPADTLRIADKLHRRFAHSSTDRISKLLKNAKAENTDEITKKLEEIEKKCKFCIRHKRSSPAPDVCLPLADKFNELVCMDLKMIDNTWVLHCIDYLTRFSAAHVLKNKSAEEIIEKFSLIWISVFGPPENILSDNGCEFSNPKMQIFCCSFNITQKFTAAEAPFSNGICERHNALIGKMTTKVVNDQKCRLNIALLWAIHAKNSLLNIYGFSPYQLVFGHNPNIPGNSNNRLPALSTPNDDIVREHLNCLHKARSAYIEAENSNRIRRALAGKLFTGTYQKFCPGDKVYYKRLRKNGWQGPGIVLAHEVTPQEMKSFQETLGRLQWITSQSRPDMRFAALECSLRTDNTQVQDILVLNKAIKKLKKLSSLSFHM